MRNVTGSLNRAGLKIIAWLGAVCMLGLTAFVWFYTVRRATTGEVQIERDSLGGNLLCFLLLLLLAYAVGRGCGFLSRRKMHVLEIIMAVGITAGLFYLVREAAVTEVVADPAQVLFGAEWLLDGNYEEISGNPYFWVYPHQLQLSKFWAGIIRVGGKPVWESLQLLQYVNAVCAGLTFYAGARITGELFEDVRAEGLYLLLAIPFAPMYIYVLFLYGEVIGLCCAMLAIWLFLPCDREEQSGDRSAGWSGRRAAWRWRCLSVLRWIGVAFFLWIACTMRAALLIVWIAMAVIGVLTSLRKKKWKPVLCILLVLICVLGGQKLYESSLERQTGTASAQGAPAILWVAMGMQGGEEVSDNPGGYNGYNWDTFTQCGYDAEAAARQAGEDIAARFAEWRDDPGGMIRVLKSKLLNQWAEPSYSAFSSTRMLSGAAQWVTDLWYNEAHVKLYNGLNRYQSCAYLLICVYLCSLAFARGGDGERRYLPGLILLGGFLFSVIWEAQSRYIYPYVVIAMPCMAGGLLLCLAGVDRLVQKFKGFKGTDLRGGA
ncbi:MAG: hypothetical protein NC079_06765 [Clostridium sp.]|nr:hypothetical protein [Acetatifactor muris]MCM1526907.1 hypothetical protein [Bacteroides sp.]MCM1563299.1 hypothetical protein [Clostridium sp.]